MLTQDQITFFHTNGYLRMPGLIHGRELSELRAAVDTVQAQGEARQGDHHLYMGETYWRSEQMWQRGDIFQAVAVNPDLLENIGQCTGQAFFPWNDSLVVKLAHSGAPVPWHQDPPYGKLERETTFAVPNFTTDIYLDHSGPDNGCVWAIPGHHLVGNVALKGKSHEDLLAMGGIPLEMEAGDVLFHCLSTPHGSLPNTSDRQRRIFYIHSISDEAYRDGYGQEAWATNKPGWGAARRELIETMLARRKALGFESPLERGTLTFGEGGFSFMQAPSTPPRYWGTLADAMPPGERITLKQLTK